MVRNYYPSRLKRFNNSLLNEKIPFFKLKLDENGMPPKDEFGNQLEVYEFVMQVWANLQLVPIEDKELNSTVYNKLKYKAIIRYTKKIDENNFFLYKGVMYRINYAEDFYGEGRFLDCLGTRIEKSV